MIYFTWVGFYWRLGLWIFPKKWGIFQENGEFSEKIHLDSYGVKCQDHQNEHYVILKSM